MSPGQTAISEKRRHLRTCDNNVMVKPPVSDETVKRATGRDWAEWRRLLDAAGARAMNHTQIARMVHDRFGGGDWWSQMVTVGYERLSGLRLAHQRPGGFEISKSKTIGAPIGEVFDAWHTPAKRKRWLADPDIEIRAVKAPISIRFASGDGKTQADVRLTKNGEKTAVTVTHRKIATANAAEKFKKYWRDQLLALAAQLTMPSTAPLRRRSSSR
jgi:hypothetical protein